MNPDDYGKTVSKWHFEYHLMLCVDGAPFYVFRVHDTLVDIVRGNESTVVYLEDARKEWARLMKLGYKLTKTEKRKTNTVNKHLLTDDYASAKIDAVKQLDKMYKKEGPWEKYHENDLQEMRINPKKKFTNEYATMNPNNYALEA